MEQRGAADGEAAGCSSPGSWQFCAIFAEPYMKRAISVQFSMQAKMAGKNVYSAKHPFIVGAFLRDIHFAMGPLVAETVYVLRSQTNQRMVVMERQRRRKQRVSLMGIHPSHKWLMGVRSKLINSLQW